MMYKRLRIIMIISSIRDMWRFLIFIVVALYLFYYGTVVMHAFGQINLTNRKMTFWRCFIPFYFWIAPTNEKPKKVKKKIFDDILKKQ